MNKKELVRHVALNSQYNYETVMDVVTTAFKVMREHLLNHEEVVIKGVGKLKICKRHARILFEPRQQKHINIGDRWYVRYQQSKTLKIKEKEE